MNMKRKIAMALTLIMMMALILPQTALAVTRYYLSVSITQANGSYSLTDTSGYLNRTESLTAEVVSIINNNYTDANKANETGLYGFGSKAMGKLAYNGLRAYKNGTLAAWSGNYTVTDTNGIAAMLKNTSTKVDALTEGTTYQLVFKPNVADSKDPARGNTYTVTIQLNSYSGVDGQVEVKDGANGSASVSPANASKGQKVTVTVKPDEGYVPSRILVTDKDGNTIRATYEGNNKYSFTMPVGGATVTPVFRKQTASPAETGVAELLNADDHVAFMVGDDKGNFRPNDSITRAEVAQIFYRLLKNQNVAVTRNFDDVASDAWYAAAVNTLASMGILNGTSATAFEPERAITRAEFTAICTRFAKELKGTKSFTDVPESFWAYNNIAAAAEFGWILGDGTGKFNPNADITRAEAAAIVNRMLGRLSDFDAIDAGEGKSFPDVSESFWGFYNIAEATSGHDHSFDSEKLHEDWK